MILNIYTKPTAYNFIRKIDLKEDFGFTQQEWNALSKEKQEEILTDYIDERPQIFEEVSGWKLTRS